MSGCKDCAKAQKRIEDLEEQLAYIKFKLDDLQSKRYKSNKKKPPDDTPPLLIQKKRGGLFGHVGWFRKKPKTIDRLEEVRLDKCPECGSSGLTECEDIHDHVQEDIVLPRVEVVLYRKHRYYCKHCQRVFMPKGNDEIPGSRIGLRRLLKIRHKDIGA